MENIIKSKIREIELLSDDISSEYYLNHFDKNLIHFTIKDSDGNKGFGTSRSISTAIDIAKSEYIERIHMRFYSRVFDSIDNSNGFSVHPLKNKSIEKSKLEIIERDALLTSWLSKTSPFWIQENDYEKILSNENFTLYKRCLKSAYIINFGIIRVTSKTITCIIRIDCKDFSKNAFFIDTKSGFDISEIVNSLIESVSFYTHHIEKNNYTPPLQKKFNSAIDHFHYYMKHNEDVEWFFKSATHIESSPPVKLLTFQIPNLINRINYKSKLYINYTPPDFMQNFYIGTDFSCINIKRLYNLYPDLKSINSQPHPLS